MTNIEIDDNLHYYELSKLELELKINLDNSNKSKIEILNESELNTPTYYYATVTIQSNNMQLLIDLQVANNKLSISIIL